MDINQIVEWVSSLPGWAWVIIVLVILFLFGDRKLWEYEVKFPLQKGIGRGEVEFESLKKKGTSVEVKFELDAAYQHKDIEIYLNDQLVFTVPKEKNDKHRLYLVNKLEMNKPQEADEVSVRINGQSVFSGLLVRD